MEIPTDNLTEFLYSSWWWKIPKEERIELLKKYEIPFDSLYVETNRIRPEFEKVYLGEFNLAKEELKLKVFIEKRSNSGYLYPKLFCFYFSNNLSENAKRWLLTLINHPITIDYLTGNLSENSWLVVKQSRDPYGELKINSVDSFIEEIQSKITELEHQKNFYLKIRELTK